MGVDANFAFSNYYYKLPTLAPSIKLVPVIADGNCAFRSIIQSMLLHGVLISSDNQKVQTASFLHNIYFKHKQRICASRKPHQRTANINDTDFDEFINDFDLATINDYTFEAFVNKNFPAKFNYNTNNYDLPENDKVIKFLAYCLRIELIERLAEGFAEANELNEYNYANIAQEQVLLYLANCGFHLEIYDLRAQRYCTDRNHANSNLITIPITFDNGHYIVPFAKETFKAAKDFAGMQDGIEDILDEVLFEFSEIDNDLDFAFEHTQLQQHDADLAFALELMHNEQAEIDRLKLEQADADYALALEMEENLQQSEYKNTSIQEQQDLLFAQQLEQENGPMLHGFERFANQMPAVFVEDRFTVLQQNLTEICNSAAVAGANAADLGGAHDHTNGLIRAGYQNLVELNDSFLLPDADQHWHRYDELIVAIANTAEVIGYNQMANLTTVLNSISASIRASDGEVEAETGIKLYDILSRTWSSAMDLDLSQNNNDNRVMHDFRMVVIECLENNLSDNGGCMAGVIARLYAVYATNLSLKLEQQVQRFTPARPVNGY